ncbi:MAG TPA: type II secretion system F family protein [Pirellulales bacterium]|nr:type II secretion system F family protein [Pirellulales bacterium]
MAIYAYQAVDAACAVVRGTVAADGPRQARDQLRRRGLAVQSMREAAARQGARWKAPWSRRYGSKVTATVRELATLLGVGIPLTDAIDTLARQERGGFRTALLLLRDRVSAGVGLAEAMAEQGDVFDPLSVRMVEIGENSGTLEAVLEQLAGFKERAGELKDRVLSALLYPAIVLAVSLAVTIFLMVVVVPMLLSNLLEAGRTLPWPTRLLKGTSDLLVERGWLPLSVLALAVVATAVAVRTRSGRRAWHRLLLKIPLIGPMARKQTIARMALVLATLIRSGIVYLKAVEIVVRSTSNVIFREALEQSGREVGAGQDISRALERTGVFPPLVVHIFSVGQHSGRLEEMLERLARDYDRQVASSSARLASALEPLLILTLALFVGFILFATLLPILEAGNVL